MTGDPPVYLSPKERRVWNIYSEIISISGTDSYGLPTLTMLEFYLEHVSIRPYSRKEFDLLIEQLLTIHSMYRMSMAEEMKRK